MRLSHEERVIAMKFYQTPKPLPKTTCPHLSFRWYRKKKNLTRVTFDDATEIQLEE